MSKKLLQYYRSKMDVGGKVLPKYQSTGLFNPRERVISESTSNPNLIKNVQADIALQQQRAYKKIQEAREKQGTIKQATPQKSIASKTLSILANPMTAASYVVKGQRIPDNFDKASTNVYDVATSIINPINAIYDLSNAYSDVKKGDYGSASLNLLSGSTSLPSIGGWSQKFAPRFSYATSKAAAKGDIKSLGEIATLSAINAAAPVLSKAPITKDIYKAAAYRVGKFSGGEPGANINSRIKNIFSKRKSTRSPYTGAEFQPYLDDAITKPNDGRDLLRQYIYGDSPSFEKSNLIPKGLEKYYDRYGNMDVFKLKSVVPEKQMLEVPLDNYYNTLLKDKINNAGGFSKIDKTSPIGVDVSHPMNNPIKPLDDIGGHMTYLERKGPNQFNLTSQDIWKFTPEDYVQRYGAINPNTGLMEPESYAMYLKAKLMERAGKPFILMQENPLKFTRPSYKTQSSLAQDVDVDMYGLTQEDIENSLKDIKLINKEKGGPILSTQGYKQGPPPQGGYYRIPSNTLYNPTPYRIKAVANTGQVQYLNPFDESNVNFPGADYVDEFPIMQKGGLVSALFVDDLNDPRLRAYGDSMMLYNQTKGMIDDLKNYERKYGNPKAGSNQNVFVNKWLDYTNNWYKNKGPKMEPAYNRLTKKNKKAPKPNRTYESRLDPDQVAVEYKKPVQPVVFRKPEIPTLYVDDLNNPRLRAYNDSLSAYNIDKNWEKFLRTVPDMKYTAEEIDKLSDKYRIPITKPSLLNLAVTDKNGVRKTDYTREVLVNDNQRRDYYSPVFAKPKQKVEYRKPEPSAPSVQQIASQQVVVPLPVPQRQYTGTPVYSPGAGSGIPSALIGFRSDAGDIDYIQPEDYQRYAVPQYAQEYIKSLSKKQEGGSLNRTVICSNCGWSWKLSDGGKNPMTCHKCGGMIKMKSGGQHGGLDRWFAEKWVDVKTGKACGRQEGESRAGYPACRPSKRISSKTPKTSSEMSSAEKAKFKRSKTSSQRIPYNHKRK